MKKKALLYSFIILYAIAGVLHFLIPEVYLEAIPDWLGNKMLVNYTAGIVEISVALLAFFSKTRKTAGIITMAMLLAFSISHVYFLQNGSCAGDFCIPSWIGWMRLLIIHPLLIFWAWKISRL
ncbi:MAG: hypothetical protein QMB11_02075 [Nonlabens sp.]|jgi:uncharacterized membrane protein|uniref:DoxX family protein n=1 Tax=Nonlabens sp. TaxID=1888209 RepID=UPI0035A6CD7F